MKEGLQAGLELALVAGAFYLSCLFYSRPRLLRRFGAWVGSRLIALGYAIEDHKDTYKLKSRTVYAGLEKEY